MSQVSIYYDFDGDPYFEVNDLLESVEFRQFIKEKIRLTTHLAKSKRGRQRTFKPDARLHDVYNFLHDCIEIIHKDVKISDPIIGEWDIRPFLKKSYRVTIEEMK